jgi:hypothetical protein
MAIASWKMRAAFAAALLLLLASVESATAQGGNNAPMIVGLEAVQVPGAKFRIYGRVADETPGSCSVTISGAASGTLLCDSNGNFDGIFNVPVMGGIIIFAYDGQLYSDGSAFPLANAAPTTTISAVHGFGYSWTISGVVTDEARAGLTVTLTGPPGINGRTATVLANGTWSITATLGPRAQGIATATVTDWYGLTGSASTYIGS